MSNARRLWTPNGAADEPAQTVTKMDTTGPQLRLIRCTDCRTIDELPDYEGDPAHDVLLSELLLNKHVYGSGTTHEVALIKVPAKMWRDTKMQPRIVAQLSQGASEGLAEVDRDFYSTKNTYQEDALKCFNAHHRPKGADCIDYRGHDKRIGNPTKEGWRGGAKVFICSFCPIQAKVDAAKRGEIASG